ncbi:MAG: TetR/AcrR family transcriptional regulator [Acidobacteria bacterium]|jgi:TetR/AcrR family fatty acid metabolism transcriptional regulator|nr:TetR/AcrR family transcriptional regulator [Acidobacteriota bacterium]
MRRLNSLSGQAPRSAAAVVVDKREAILRAATKVFARKGYFNSKVADVAGAAGIADGTVYLYFKSKNEILHSIFDRAMEEFIAEGKREIAPIDEADKRLRRIAELHLEKLGADRDLAIVFQVELRGSTKFMEEFSAAGFAEYLSIIHQTIEDGQKAGVFRADLNATICSKILFGALDEMVTNWILSKKHYELKPLANEVLKVFFGGVLK